MIENILERLREKSNEWFERWAKSGSEDEYADGRSDSFDEAIQIVQEVAKEYGKDTNVRSNEYEKGYEDGYEEGAEAVRALAPYEDGWIPVSERLPEEKETVILSTQLGTCAGCYFCGGWYRENMLCYDSAVRERDVIAWKPLPAPYQKGE